jgi:hypothetical protein
MTRASTVLRGAYTMTQANYRQSGAEDDDVTRTLAIVERPCVTWVLSLLFLEHILFQRPVEAPPTGSPCSMLKDGLPVDVLSEARCWTGHRKRRDACDTSCMAILDHAKQRGDCI